MFLLLLMGLGAAGVKAQVRIGGNASPNAAAVLDLNATDAATNGTKGLALPRVSLADTVALLSGVIPLNGMLVYNTNASMTGGSGVGTYYWTNNKWIKIVSSPVIGGSSLITVDTTGFHNGDRLRWNGTTFIKDTSRWNHLLVSIPAMRTVPAGSYMNLTLDSIRPSSWPTWCANTQNSATYFEVDGYSNAILNTNGVHLRIWSNGVNSDLFISWHCYF